MKPLLRAVVALSIATTVLPVANAIAQDTGAQGQQALTSDRDKASYMVGMDVGQIAGAGGAGHRPRGLRARGAQRLMAASR